MIDFARMNVTGLATHYIGNFGLGEEMKLSEHPIMFKDEFVKGIFYDYLLSGFKNDIYYRFRKSSDFLLHTVKEMVDKMFKDGGNKTFFDISKEIGQFLYAQTLHPKVKGGELYIAYIKDVVVDGELCDAIGIFKSESKDTFIKVDFNVSDFSIETELGISPKKLEKGILIFNIDGANGYKAAMIDNSNKISDAATYWSREFLDMELRPSSYFYTNNYINQAISFCEEVLTEENNVNKNDKMMILNNAVGFFDKNVEFNKEEFVKEVLDQTELIKAFNEHQDKYCETFNIPKVDNFSISKTAVKKHNKFLKSRIKLDEHISIELKGNHHLVENGFDEEKKMKYYKVYYINEE